MKDTVADAQHKGRQMLLFDLDGTLTESRQAAKTEIREALKVLRQQATIGIVSGTDIPKIVEQLFGFHAPCEKAFEMTDYIFGENGTVSLSQDPKFFDNSQYKFHKVLGEERYQSLVDYILSYFASLKIPCKRGTFIELRAGVLNISPIGRNCSREERLEFEKYDQIHQVRQKMINEMKQKFSTYNLSFAIGGQISMDVYINGWDKRLCLQRLEEKGVCFETIHFFGDKTYEGGNDHALYEDHRVIGHAVRNPQETLQILESLSYQIK